MASIPIQLQTQWATKAKPSPDAMRIPGDNQRLAIYGQTGSGKTIFGKWILSHQNIDEKPWFLIDFKRDEHLNSIPFAQYLSLKTAAEDVPEAPGVYILQPIPEVDDAQLDDFLWQVWSKENAGLFVDEGYMVPKNSKPWNAILTQGRSKNIGTITLSQRPVFLNRFVISEAEFHSVFFLSDLNDRDRVQRFVRGDIMSDLPEFHSYWYDVAARNLNILSPVPPADFKKLDKVYREKLKPKTIIL